MAPGPEISMLGAALNALYVVLDPIRLLYMAGAVMLGLIIGLLPGIGGLTGFALIMPFTFTMDPYTAFACLLGMAAVVNTSDTIPAVLLGVPGTAAAQATVLDGVQMTRKGEAGRAMAAAYTASMIGGIFGAGLLAVSVPIIKPLVLAIGNPELFALTVVAVSLVAALSGSVPLRGMVAACLGIALSMVGSAPQSGNLRWTFGALYLWDGLPLLPIIMGIFALPELCDLAVGRSSQYDGELTEGARVGMMRGIRDALKNWFLVIRCASIGALIGTTPGLSGSVADWLAYGHGMKSVKGGKKTFGKGDVRGVIAPESANNAVTGGALIPTLAFGVPGNGQMAVLIGALMIHGITPGPEMLTTQLGLTYSMMWTITLANIVGAGLCLALSPQFAKMSMIRYSLILPGILTVVYIGAFQGSRSWGDLIALLLFGILGWAMKRLRWPRPPLILGFVLGVLMERYLTLSISLHGMTWLWRPTVLILFAITLFALSKPLMEICRHGLGTKKLSLRPRFKAPDLMYVFFIGVFGLLAYQTIGWQYESLVGPRVVTISALIFAFIGLFNQTFVIPTERKNIGSETLLDLSSTKSSLPSSTVLLRGLQFFGWMLFFMVLLGTVGILATIPIFVVSFMRLQAREPWKLSIIYALFMTLFVFGLFDQFLHLHWPRTFIGTEFPVLRHIIPTL